MQKTIFSNEEYVKNTIEKIKADWLDNLHILADFDRTLTKAFSKTWEKVASLVYLLRSAEKELWDDAAQEDTILFNKYHSIEIDPNINIEEKREKMIEWWKASFGVFIKYWLNKNILRNIAKSEKIELRKWIVEFLHFLTLNNIPLIIISASWIWKKSISYFLEERWLFTNNIKIISNDFNWDKNGKALSYKEPIIHSFNKWETVLEEFPEVYNLIKERKNVILLWDSLWDPAMIEGFNYKNLLKIWFLNEKEEEYLSEYKEIYDVILTWDNSWEFLNTIL